MLFDIAIIILLIVLNGFFAMSEMAVVSARKPRLSMRAEAGSRAAKTALKLANDPSKFLASVQIGITLIGILSGAYSGATLAEPLGDYFSDHLGIATWGDDAAIALVVIVITYLSLIIGELVPKQLALKHAETIACMIALPIRVLAVITQPLVYVLHQSNHFILNLMGVKEGVENSVTEQEVKAIITEGVHSGALEREEQAMLERVMRLNDYDISVTMTHRTDIVWFDVDESAASIFEKIERTRHSHYPVCEGNVEQLIGLVAAKDLLIQQGSMGSINLRTAARKPMCLDTSLSILQALEEFKQSTSHIAILVDPHGVLQGIVTLKDLMEAIIGTLPEPSYRGDEAGVQREDGSWLLDGGLSILETEEILGISHMIPEDANVRTLAGFILLHHQSIPVAGDHFTWRGWRFEVVDMDRNRVDKVLVSRQSPA